MKRLIALLMCALLAAGLAVGCDDDAGDADEAVEEQQAPDDDGEVVEEEAAAGEEIIDGDRAEFELEGSQWLESDLYGIKVRIPDDWETSETAELVSANDPAGSTTAIIGGSESDQTLQDAIDNLKEDLEFSDVELEESRPTSLGGFPGHQGRGSGVLVREDDIDEEIQFLGYALRVDDDKNATLMIFSEATMYEAKRDVIDGIANTIERI